MRVARKTVARWCQDDKLEHIKTPGGHYRIRESVALELIRNGAPEETQVSGSILDTTEQDGSSP